MSIPAIGPDERKRKAHLDASVQHVEKALLARADQVGSHLDIARKQARINGINFSAAQVSALAGMISAILSAELRAVAEELHYS